jgi:hypothetical protein
MKLVCGNLSYPAAPHRIGSTIVQIGESHLPEILGWTAMEGMRPCY